MVIYKKNLPLHRFHKKEVGFGTLAQLVEHRTENPGVPGSIPGGTTQDRFNGYQIISNSSLKSTVYKD